MLLAPFSQHDDAVSYVLMLLARNKSHSQPKQREKFSKRFYEKFALFLLPPFHVERAT